MALCKSKVFFVSVVWCGPSCNTSVLMDQDFVGIRGLGSLRLGPTTKQAFMTQLTHDVQLLRVCCVLGCAWCDAPSATVDPSLW
jgi:hypothetical protein